MAPIRTTPPAALCFSATRDIYVYIRVIRAMMITSLLQRNNIRAKASGFDQHVYRCRAFGAVVVRAIGARYVTDARCCHVTFREAIEEGAQRVMRFATVVAQDAAAARTLDKHGDTGLSSGRAQFDAATYAPYASHHTICASAICERCQQSPQRQSLENIRVCYARLLPTQERCRDASPRSAAPPCWSFSVLRHYARVLFMATQRVIAAMPLMPLMFRRYAQASRRRRMRRDARARRPTMLARLSHPATTLTIYAPTYAARRFEFAPPLRHAAAMRRTRETRASRTPY